MPNNKLTQAEADKLLNMLKESLVSNINFPQKGESVEFELIGNNTKDLFISRIYRGKINRLKYEMGARIKKDNILLLELHINPGKTHINPDGTKIDVSHWHIYKEKYGRKFAFPAEDINSENFVENTIMFLEKFNVIQKPIIDCQLEFL